MDPRTESEIIIEGSDLEEALDTAANRLGVDRFNLEYRVVDSDVGGFFGMFFKNKITVRAWKRNSGAYLTEADEFLAGLLDRMNINARVIGKETTDGLLLIIEGDMDGLIIGKKGQTLDALQYIVNRYMQRDPNRKVRVILDCEGYRKKREQIIRRMALSISRRVKKTGRPMAAQPMDSGERRLFHLALKSDAEIRTESRGEGDKRKVIVYPVKR
jgi:spoIIIJ-associated protein